jgi:hypothetical protein
VPLLESTTFSRLGALNFDILLLWVIYAMTSFTEDNKVGHKYSIPSADFLSQSPETCLGQVEIQQKYPGAPRPDNYIIFVYCSGTFTGDLLPSSTTIQRWLCLISVLSFQSTSGQCVGAKFQPDNSKRLSYASLPPIRPSCEP